MDPVLAFYGRLRRQDPTTLQWAQRLADAVRSGRASSRDHAFLVRLRQLHAGHAHAPRDIDRSTLSNLLAHVRHARLASGMSVGRTLTPRDFAHGGGGTHATSLTAARSAARAQAFHASQQGSQHHHGGHHGHRRAGWGIPVQYVDPCWAWDPWLGEWQYVCPPPGFALAPFGA